MSILSKSGKSAVINKPHMPLSKRIQRDFQKHWRLYLLFLPVLAYFIIFKYAPMAGLVISFQDYKAAKGIAGSKWVGMKHFINFFNDPFLPRLLRNTLPSPCPRLFSLFHRPSCWHCSSMSFAPAR